MGLFVMVDGLDGSGKGVAVDALKDWALKKGLKVIDLRKWWKENDTRDITKEDSPKGIFPDINEYDVIISCEMTYTGWGKKLREEMVKNGTPYSPEQIAEAYSKDRKELYEKIIIPALEKDKYIFQERGIITSLVYQPIHSTMSLEEVKNLEGNKFSLEYPPDLVIITVVEPEVVMERLEEREKKDEAIFEKIEFQKKVKDIYKSDWLKKIFEDKGAKVIYLDTNPPSTPVDTKNKTIKIFEENN